MRDNSFTAFPNWIFRKQESSNGWADYKEIATIVALQSFAGGINGSPIVYPSIARLAAMLGMDRKTVMAAIKRLEAKGLVEKHPRYQDGSRITNCYKLKIWPSSYCASSEEQRSLLEMQDEPEFENEEFDYEEEFGDEKEEPINEEAINEEEPPTSKRKVTYFFVQIEE